MSSNVIGRADGPASIILSSESGLSWINFFGFAIVILLLLPNVIYAVKFRGMVNRCKNKVMNLLEQIGRYASMFFMSFNIGIAEFGFASPEAFIIYYVGNIILLIAYCAIWVLYFKKIVLWKRMALVVIPTAIFLLSGITLRHYLLVISAIVFGIGHSYVTYQNVNGNLA